MADYLKSPSIVYVNNFACSLSRENLQNHWLFYLEVQCKWSRGRPDEPAKTLSSALLADIFVRMAVVTEGATNIGLLNDAIISQKDHAGEERVG